MNNFNHKIYLASRKSISEKAKFTVGFFKAQNFGVSCFKKRDRFNSIDGEKKLRMVRGVSVLNNYSKELFNG